MTRSSDQLRKAALLMRSVDSDTAAVLLAQLSPEEATAVREAMRSLGPVDADEQADLVAEFRRSSASAAKSLERGVELSISESTMQDAAHVASHVPPPPHANAKRFEFLESAPIRGLVPYLSREHAQTVAVVLSHLEPSRAASVLAELPQNLQAEAIERLSNLGEADAETVRVIEHELEAWMKQRAGDVRNRGQRKDAVALILSAADVKTRDRIVASLKTRNSFLAAQIGSSRPERETLRSPSQADSLRAATRSPRAETYQVISTRVAAPRHIAKRPMPPAPSPPPIAFDDLIHLDSRSLARVLQAADPNVLALALTGSREELVDRICDQMPKRMAKTFRRELRKLGPTRLSDVEAAQRAVAQLAAQHMAERRAKVAGMRV
jgi:flagellar motor switch protein FliG